MCLCYETKARDHTIGLHQYRGETRVSPWDGSHQFGETGGTRVTKWGLEGKNHVGTLFSFLRSILQGSARMISYTDNAPRLVSSISTSIRNEISNQLVDYLKLV